MNRAFYSLLVAGSFSFTLISPLAWAQLDMASQTNGQEPQSSSNESTLGTGKDPTRRRTNEVWQASSVDTNLLSANRTVFTPLRKPEIKIHSSGARGEGGACTLDVDGNLNGSDSVIITLSGAPDAQVIQLQ